VREEPGVQREDDRGCIIFPEQKSGDQQDRKNEQIMKQEPAAQTGGGKQQVAKRFIDKIREGCPDDAGDDPPAIVEESGDQEPEDNAGEEVEEKKHVYCRGYIFI